MDICTYKKNKKNEKQFILYQTYKPNVVQAYSSKKSC